MTDDLEGRLHQHRSGRTHTTKRLGGNLRVVASRSFEKRSDAAAIERKLKAWKNPLKAIAFLTDS